MASVGTILPPKERRFGDVIFGVLEFRVAVADLTAAAVTETLDIDKFPANAVPLRARLNIGAYFTGGGAASCTAQLGDTGDPNGLLAALNVFGVTTKGTWTGTDGVEAEYGSTGPAEESAYAPKILFTSDVNVADLTTGSLTGRIHYKRYVDN